MVRSQKKRVAACPMGSSAMGQTGARCRKFPHERVLLRQAARRSQMGTEQTASFTETKMVKNN